MKYYIVSATKKCHYKIKAENFMEAVRKIELAHPYIVETYNYDAKEQLQSEITESEYDLRLEIKKREKAMLRKCKITVKWKCENKPAWFHGWYQFGDKDNGIDAGGVVEFDDGTCDWFSPSQIKFDTPPTAEDLQCANLHQLTAANGN